ncbi:MAG: transaldolase, partial [Nitrospirota bacterium]
MMNRFSASLGRYEEPINRVLQSLDQNRFSERLWAMDAILWKTDPEIQKKIKNRLGWLTVTKAMAEQSGELMEFARSVRDAGFTHVVLLGMGGSSLCPEVFRMTFGVAKGYPDLIVLDTTDPATILNVEKRLDLTKTLFIVASKSGTTIEVESLYCYFYEKLKAMKRDSIGEHFIAITDPGTPLEGLAKRERFRRLFINPPDIGGRYSALSWFGLIPAALIGMDIKLFLERAEEMV